MEDSIVSTPPLSAQVVHHHVPWLTEVSSSQARAISAASPEQDVDRPLLEDILDHRVLEYIKAHSFYTPTAASTSSV